MPKKKPGITPEEQGKRFVADAQRMIDAGELNPIAGERGIDAALKPQPKPRCPS